MVVITVLYMMSYYNMKKVLLILVTVLAMINLCVQPIECGRVLLNLKEDQNMLMSSLARGGNTSPSPGRQILGSIDKRNFAGSSPRQHLLPPPPPRTQPIDTLFA